MSVAIGVDLGGTNVRAAAVDVTTGKVSAFASVPARADQGPHAVIERMAELILAVARRAGEAPDSVGIGVPGLYDPDTNVVRLLHNLPTGWRDVPLGMEIGSRIGVQVALINDARAFVLAESAYGAGRGAEVVIGVTLGTGVGGGIVIGGRVLMGLDGSAGEIGHMIVEANGLRCGCGGRGCLEAYVSGPAIAARGMWAVRQGVTTLLRDLCEGDLDRITPLMVARAAARGDAAARDILKDAGDYLGIGVASLVSVFSPDVIVIGGGVSGSAGVLMRSVRRQVRERCFVTPHERVKIVSASMGDRAGCIGAAVWGFAYGR